MGAGVIVDTIGTIGGASAMGTTGIMCCAGWGKVGSTRLESIDRWPRKGFLGMGLVRGDIRLSEWLKTGE